MYLCDIIVNEKVFNVDFSFKNGILWKNITLNLRILGFVCG